MPRRAQPSHTVLERLRAEYLEMPGLSLRPKQVQRLCGIERAMCQLVLNSLVGEKFLCVKADGQYARVTTGHHPSPVKVTRRTDTPATKAS